MTMSSPRSHPGAARVGVGGPVGSGKTALLEQLIPRFLARGTEIAVVTNDLVTAEDCFFVASGITDGELMQGVHFRAHGATSQSLVMRSRSGTVRLITSEHQFEKIHSL